MTDIAPLVLSGICLFTSALLLGTAAYTRPLVWWLDLGWRWQLHTALRCAAWAVGVVLGLYGIALMFE